MGVIHVHHSITVFVVVGAKRSQCSISQVLFAWHHEKEQEMALVTRREQILYQIQENEKAYKKKDKELRKELAALKERA